MIRLLFTLLAFASTATANTTPQTCRAPAARVVLADLNQNGKLWELKVLRNGEVQIIVQNKVWLDLADEELFYCDNSWSQRICVNYKFQDPETRRFEHLVVFELTNQGCSFVEYKNIVGKRPWR